VSRFTPDLGLDFCVFLLARVSLLVLGFSFCQCVVLFRSSRVWSSVPMQLIAYNDYSPE